MYTLKIDIYKWHACTGSYKYLLKEEGKRSGEGGRREEEGGRKKDEARRRKDLALALCCFLVAPSAF